MPFDALKRRRQFPESVPPAKQTDRQIKAFGKDIASGEKICRLMRSNGKAKADYILVLK